MYSHIQAVAASREVEPAEKEKCVSLFDECMQELDIGVHDVKLGKRRDLIGFFDCVARSNSHNGVFVRVAILSHARVWLFNARFGFIL